MANELTYQSEFTGQQMDARFAAVAELQTALTELQAAVAAKYSKPAEGIPSTDLDADVNAALAKANSAIQSLADYYTKAEVDALLAAINAQEYVDVSTLPTASASTMGKIYLVGPDGSGYYSYYISSYDGSAYSWVGPLGTTEISLANYATKSEFNQLDQDVNGTPVILGAYDADIHQLISTNPFSEGDTGTRLRLLYPVKVGDKMTASCPLGKGVVAGVYNTTRNAVVMGAAGRLQFIEDVYTLSTLSATITAAGYLDISFAKSDDSAFSAQDKADFLAAADIRIEIGGVDGGLVELRPAVARLENDINGGELVLTEKDASWYPSLAGVLSPFPTRLRAVLPVKVGARITASCYVGSGVAASIYDSIEKCLVADTNYLQTISYSYLRSLEGVSQHNGFLCVSLAKSDNTVAFTDADRKVFQLNTRITVKMTSEGPERKSLFIGSLVNKSINASGMGNDSTTRASMLSVAAVPYERAEILCELPEDYYLAFRSGDKAENLATSSGWYEGGQRFQIIAGHHYYRCSFGKNRASNNDCVGNIPASEVMQLIETGKIRLSYIDRHDVVRDNGESEKYVKAMMREYYTTASLNNTLPNLPVFAHISDIHGDATRFHRFLEYCDTLGVVAALASGDHVALNPSNGYQYFNDVADKHQTMVLPCVGNHDVRGLTTAQAQNEQTVGYLITKNSATVNSQEVYPTYYYKDFASPKIRVISLNLYELSRSSQDGCNFTAAQCNWFISSLASTPAGYGVLVMLHQPEAEILRDAEHDDFFQPHITALWYKEGITGNPIRDIIDAFISKTSATITYTSQGTSISTSADFTGVASGVEFIAYIMGHEHADWIGVLSGATNRQLALDVTCGIALYGSTYAYLANIADIPRGGEGPTQDAFNIYAIDRVNKTVRVARVGSNVTPEAKDRKCMIIPYAES